MLKQEAVEIQKKLHEKDKVYSQNRDLVTKNCSQQSWIDRLRRDAKEKDRKIEELTNEANRLRMTAGNSNFRLQAQGAMMQSQQPRRPSLGMGAGKDSQRATPIVSKDTKAPLPPSK